MDIRQFHPDLRYELQCTSGDQKYGFYLADKAIVDCIPAKIR